MMQFLIFLIIYILPAYFIFRIAKKLHERLALLAWFPLVSDYLIVRLAGKPFYWWLLMYIPILNFYYDFILWKEIYKKFGKGKIYAILMLVPPVNLIELILLAFIFKTAKSKPETEEIKTEPEIVKKVETKKDPSSS
jgi:hypothetical protein